MIDYSGILGPVLEVLCAKADYDRTTSGSGERPSLFGPGPYIPGRVPALSWTDATLRLESALYRLREERRRR